MKCFLNVGGGSKLIRIPPYYAGWKHDLLDIDPSGNPDIVADARNLFTLPPASYDAVYCAHNLEHYHRHEVPRVLEGFRHVLKPDGFVEIRVPDLAGAMRHAVQYNLDIDDVLYRSDVGQILLRDLIYGYHVEIERSGNDFFCHKTGFSAASLARTVESCGFPVHAIAAREMEIVAICFTQSPSAETMKMLGLQQPG